MVIEGATIPASRVGRTIIHTDSQECYFTFAANPKTNGAAKTLVSAFEEETPCTSLYS